MRRLSRPSTRAYAAAVAKGLPFVVTGGTAGWRALERWKDPGYLAAAAGHRTVPIEVGASHRPGGGGSGSGGTAVSVAGQQLLVTLDQYMQDYVFAAATPPPLTPSRDRSSRSGSKRPRVTGASGTEPGRDAKRDRSTITRVSGLSFAAVSPVVPVTAARTEGYLAQHRFFEQVTALRGDFGVPAYCKDKNPAVNIWFGAGGVATPLHFDRHENLLAQVVGAKRVLLVHQRYSGKLYPQTEVDNASSVDIEAPDLGKHPKFAEAVVEVCVLMPGELLYIPHSYWHAVSSLSPSISLSFWF